MPIKLISPVIPLRAVLDENKLINIAITITKAADLKNKFIVSRLAITTANTVVSKNCIFARKADTGMSDQTTEAKHSAGIKKSSQFCLHAFTVKVIPEALYIEPAIKKIKAATPPNIELNNNAPTAKNAQAEAYK